MRPDSLLFIASVALLMGCGDDDDKSSSTDGSGGSGASPGGGSGGAQPLTSPASPKANVKFKGGARLKAELSRALELAPAEICSELGSFDCFGIHNIALGGTDAVGFGIYEPLASTTKTTPLATERVVLAGCTKRATLDFASPGSAVIFKDLPLVDGALTDPDAPAVDGAIQALYRRALARDPKAHETEAHRELYAAIEGTGKSQAPARDWAALTCMATFTTLEGLFY